MKQKRIGMLLAIISAFLYAFNVIIEKRYITILSSEMILFLMYLGSGIGLFTIHLFTKKSKKFNQTKITKKEVPRVIYIVICELFASFLIIEAVKITSASVVSLLSVFEIIMTAICAYVVFKDPVEKHEIISIILMIIGCCLLNYKNGVFSEISLSSILVIGACFFWGFENNITASISSKEPAFFTGTKCIFVSIFYLLLVLLNKTFSLNAPILIFYGFFTYGVSILTYALSTRYLGANKATIIFSFSPIFGVLLALLIYKESLSTNFLVSTIIMIASVLCITVGEDKKQ